MAKQTRKITPFAASKPPQRDERVPARLWHLPRRVEQANLAGPRYNQTELAHKSQLSQSVISKLARWSNLYGIRLETIYKLSAALKVSVAWLLGESESPERSPSKPRAAEPTETRPKRTTQRRLRVGGKATSTSRRRAG